MRGYKGLKRFESSIDATSAEYLANEEVNKIMVRGTVGTIRAVL